MPAKYRARRVSKDRVHDIKRRGAINGAVVLNAYNGFIIVEPVGSNLGDGEILPPETADSELRPPWCLDSHNQLLKARQRLHLGDYQRQLAGSGV